MSMLNKVIEQSESNIGGSIDTGLSKQPVMCLGEMLSFDGFRFVAAGLWLLPRTGDRGTGH
jgi:hypothetical protein